MDIFKCVILGCGSSDGVPQINCNCLVCCSDDPKNKRTRSSALIVSKEANIVIDTGPDFRQQVLREKLSNVDAVIYTHAHYDHVAGINEIKHLASSTLPAFMDQYTAQSLLKSFSYIFEQKSHLYKSLMKIHVVNKNFRFKDVLVHTFPQDHLTCLSYGLRFGELAYCVDVTKFTEEAYEALIGVRICIIDCMRYLYAPTHFYLDKTLMALARIKPELAILTHMAHDIEYHEIKRLLPSNVIPAYDGMEVMFRG